MRGCWGQGSTQEKVLAAESRKSLLSPFKLDRAAEPRPKNKPNSSRGQANVILKQDRINYRGLALSSSSVWTPGKNVSVAGMISGTVAAH